MHRRTFLRAAAISVLPTTFAEFCGLSGLGRFGIVNQAAAAGKKIWHYKAAKNFAKQLASEHQFSEVVLRRFLSSLTVDERVIKLMDAPKKSSGKVFWRDYQQRHVSARKIADGRAFVRRHSAILEKASARFGISGNIIAAIIGIETNYGKVLGRFDVARTLATLAFAYPRRAAEFEKELADFLLYSRTADINPITLKGSFAGAFGIPQFLPSSARQYAVDFDNNERIDLFSLPDAIGSIGNFLRAHGWKQNGGLLYSAKGVQNTDSLMTATSENEYRPFLSHKDLMAAGVSATTLPNDLYLFVDLPNRYDTEYYIGGSNFYAITRYNRSFKYAAAVVLLSEAIA